MSNVPKWINHDVKVSAIKLLGLDPYDIREITIKPDEIQAVLFDRDEQGNKVFMPGEEPGYAKHVVTIPVYDVVVA